MTGQELKGLRNVYGLSVAEAARQCEVNSRVWQRWESGERRVPPNIVKLFRLLNGNPNDPAAGQDG